jgi:hypothetical protein
MIMVAYAEDGLADTYRMFNPKQGKASGHVTSSG